MGILISLERERAVRELREALGPAEADRILRRIAAVMERAESDPMLLVRLVREMDAVGVDE